MVDLATLTGAIVVALGLGLTGAFITDEGLANRVLGAAEAAIPGLHRLGPNRHRVLRDGALRRPARDLRAALLRPRPGRHRRVLLPRAQGAGGHAQVACCPPGRRGGSSRQGCCGFAFQLVSRRADVAASRLEHRPRLPSSQR